MDWPVGAVQISYKHINYFLPNWDIRFWFLTFIYCSGCQVSHKKVYHLLMNICVNECIVNDLKDFKCFIHIGFRKKNQVVICRYTLQPAQTHVVWHGYLIQ